MMKLFIVHLPIFIGILTRLCLADISRSVVILDKPPNKISFPELTDITTSGSGNKTWLLQFDKICSVQLSLITLRGLDRMSHFFVVGPGNQVLAGDRALYLTDTLAGRKLYIPHSHAYVYYQWEDAAIKHATFTIEYKCIPDQQEAIPLVPITTPLSPPDNESLAICIKNLNEEAVYNFTNDGSLAKSFREAIEAETKIYCGSSNLTLSANIIKPVFNQINCRFSDHGNQPACRLCACFNVSIFLTDESNCSDVVAPNAFPEEHLSKILLDVRFEPNFGCGPLGVVKNEWLFLSMGYILLPAFITGTSLIVFFLVWWWNGQRFDFLQFNKPKPEKKVNLGIETVNEDGEPEIHQNPLFNKQYDTFYEPNWTDTIAEDSASDLEDDLSSKTKDGGDGNDNHGFFYNENHDRTPPQQPHKFPWSVTPEMPTSDDITDTPTNSRKKLNFRSRESIAVENFERTIFGSDNKHEIEQEIPQISTKKQRMSIAIAGTHLEDTHL